MTGQPVGTSTPTDLYQISLLGGAAASRELVEVIAAAGEEAVAVELGDRFDPHPMSNAPRASRADDGQSHSH